jgi:hypothetical protein
MLRALIRFKNIKTTEVDLNGRLNEDIIVLKAFK